MQQRKIIDEELFKLKQEGKTNAEAAKILGVSKVAVGKRVKKFQDWAVADRLNDKIKKLEPQQRKFVQGIAQGENQTDAATKAYNVSSRRSATSIGSTLMKNPRVKPIIDELRASNADILEDIGAGRRYRLTKLKTKVIDAKDPNVVVKGLDIAHRLTGEYAPERHLFADVKDSIAYFESQITDLEELRNHIVAELAGENLIEGECESLPVQEET